MRTIFTEEKINAVIDVWYGNDEVCELIARGMVRDHLEKGLDIDDRFIFDMIETLARWK